MSKTKAVSKNRFFARNSREPHCSPEVWLVEPFDEELELWTLGAEYGFVWALASADPDVARCRRISRQEGIESITGQLAGDPTHVMFAGSVCGDAIEVEVANFLISSNRHRAVDVSESAFMLARVCERLKDLQFYDGEERVDRFERDGERGGVTWTTFRGVVGDERNL